MMSHTQVIARLAALKKASMPELRTMWGELFGKEPPTYNRQFLESRLAYRIQELAFGGLRPDTKKRLVEISQGTSSSPQIRRTALSPGTILVRIWKEEEHHVKVLTEGFEYRGQHYSSLSRLACEITGTHWNGHAFFGLRRKRA